MFKSLDLYILLLLAGLSKVLCAQNETAHWIPSEKQLFVVDESGISLQSYFNLNNIQGCQATMSDSRGRLLFYFDSGLFYTKDHEVMPNGRTAYSGGAYYESIIIPYPNNRDLYYAFYPLPGINFHYGLLYSIVDMRLNSGNGDLTPTKDVLLMDYSSTNVQAVFHANGTDVWLLVINSNTKQLNVYAIDSNGINTTPQFVLNIPDMSNNRLRESFAISPDGKTIALTFFERNWRNNRISNSSLYLYDFNSTTGSISNPLEIFNNPSNDLQINEMTFSPRSKFLYYTGINGTIQLDLRIRDPAAIGTSRTVLENYPRRMYFQLAANGQIIGYQTAETGSVWIIHNPDEKGLKSNLSYFCLELDRGEIEPLSGDSSPPNFINTYFKKTFEVNNVCEGEVTEFKAALPDHFDQFSWDFGDGSTSSLENPSHQYTANESYTVSLNASSTTTGDLFTETQTVTTYNQLIAHRPNDLYLCDENADGVELFDLTSLDASIKLSQYLAGLSINYYASQEDYLNRRAISDPENYSNISNPQEIIAEIFKCGGDCRDSVRFNIGVTDIPIIDLEPFYYLCDDEELILELPDTYSEYLWSNGATTPSITINEYGEYSVETRIIENGVECEESFTFEVRPIFTIESIEVTDFTHRDNSISINVQGDEDYEYSIDGINFQSSNLFTNLEINEYTVYVRDIDQCSTVTQRVIMLYYPRFFTPNNDGYNDTWQITNGSYEPANKVNIYDRFGKFLTSFDTESQGWDGTFNGAPMPSSDYWFVMYRNDGSIYKGHFSLKR